MMNEVTLTDDTTWSRAQIEKQRGNWRSEIGKMWPHLEGISIVDLAKKYIY